MTPHPLELIVCVSCLRKAVRRIMCAAASLAILASPASAADKTWDGGGGNNNWNTASNWVGDVAPVANDALFFDGSTRLAPANNYASGTRFNGITFNSGAGAFSLALSTMNLGGNITNLSANNQAIASGTATLLQDTVIDTGASGITFSATGAKITGTYSLTKKGSGTLSVLKWETFGGNININEGTLLNASTDSTAFGTNNYTVMANGTTAQSFSIGAIMGQNGVKIANGATVTLSVLTATATNSVGAAFFGDANYGQGVTVIKDGEGALKITGTTTNANFGSTTQNTWQINAGKIILGSSSESQLGDLKNDIVLNGGTLSSGGFTLGNTKTITLNNKAGNGIEVTSSTLLITNANQVTGSGGFTKSGAGTMTLAAVQNYTGATKISEGRLILSNSLALQNSVLDTSGAGTVGLAGAAATNVTFGGLSGATDLATKIAAGYTTVTNITLNNGSGTSATYSGVVANGAAGMSLTKAGSGTQILSGNNTYSGGTLVSSGTLQVGDGGTTGSIASASGVTNNATLAYNRSDNLSASYAISGSGNVTKSGNGTLSLSGANSYSGGTLVSVGTLQGDTTSLQGAITNNAAVIFANATNGTYGSAMSGTGALTKSGAGTLTLTASNTYSGATTISDGTLVVNGSTASATTVQSGATLAGAGYLASATIASGGTISPGNSPGTLTLTNGMTWDGGGDYNWQIFDVADASKRDLISVTGGTFTLNGLSEANKFNINLWSLSGLNPDVSGAVYNFDNTQAYSWHIVSSVNPISGTFNSSYFNINTGAVNGTGGFANDLGGGLFSLAMEGNNLNLVFTPGSGPTPVPEPGTWAAAALLAAAAGISKWRRRRAKQLILPH